MSSLRERIADNWWRIRRTVKNYFILLFLLLVLTVTAFFHRIVNLVHPGEAGVKWRPFLGGTQIDTLYGEGLQLLWPWDKLYVYNVRVQQIAHEFDALSKNGLPIHFEISIRYQAIRETLPKLHQEIGPDYVEKVVKPEVQAHVRKIAANYLPEQIYTSEGYLLQIIRQGAMAAINERNILLDNLLIKRMTLPDTIREAIERKLAAEQLALQYDYVLQKEQKEADRKRIEAKGIRDFQLLARDGGAFNQYLNFHGIEATVELAKSNNAKVIFLGNRDNGLPLVFNVPSSEAVQTTEHAQPKSEGVTLSQETKDLLGSKRLPEHSGKAEDAKTSGGE